MYKVIKKNQKKFMAIFAAGLMIAFTLPSFFGQGPHDRGEEVLGSIGGDELQNKVVRQAHSDWDTLRNSVSVERFDRQTNQMRPESILLSELGESAVQQIMSNNDMYALLLEEARRMGVGVSMETVKARVANGIHVPLDTDGQPDPAALQAVRNLFMVTGAFDRISAAAHVSRPFRDHELAKLQSVAVNLVEFNAKDYVTKVPAEMDAKELQAHFDQYKDREAGVSTGNHWGFGYKIPNRVKVQYVIVEKSTLQSAVEAEISPVDVIKSYKLHPDKYPPFSTTTKTLKDLHLGSGPPPATTQSARAKFFDHAPPEGIAAPLGFEHYRDEVRKGLIDERASELSKKVIAELTATMAADFVAFNKANGSAAGAAPATSPSGPASSVGPSYGTKEYLDKLALRIQEKYKVLPVVQTQGELKTQKQLADLPEVGKSSLQIDQAVFMAIARAGDFNRLQEVQRRLQFGNFVTSFVEPLMTEDDKSFARDYRVPSIAVYQPAVPMEDGKGNQYIFRAIEASAAHAPKAVADALPQVAEDLRLLKAYALALADAQKFLDKARAQRLQPAANADQRQLVSTSLFGGELGPPTDYPLPNQTATVNFMTGVFESLGNPTPNDPAHPLGLVELKGQDLARVVVTEIAAVRPMWKGDLLATYQLHLQADLTQRSRETLRAQWYRYDDLVKRLNYRAAAVKSPQPTPTAPPQPPINPIPG